MHAVCVYVCVHALIWRLTLTNMLPSLARNFTVCFVCTNVGEYVRRRVMSFVVSCAMCVRDEK